MGKRLTPLGAALLVAAFSGCAADPGDANGSSRGRSSFPTDQVDASAPGIDPGAGGSSGGSGNTPPSIPTFDAALPSDASTFDPDAFWANDPPPAMCGGGATPITPGGTPECPDDKNRQGCPCPEVGQEASCWVGLRKNRNRGICHDGTTKCVLTGEVNKSWGPCVGYTLPDPAATSGARACQCFSSGKWKLANLSPCFWGDSGSVGATSTILDSSAHAVCPPDPPPTVPNGSFTPSTLQVDCAGHFKLCFTLKAGDPSKPQPGDCTLAQVCTETDYTTAGKEQAVPDLGPWATADASCSQQFATTGGYGEMSVKGTSVECDEVPDHVFNRVGYCPTSCNQDPKGPGCQNCMQGGSGAF
jgi:hypothetical protein